MQSLPEKRTCSTGILVDLYVDHQYSSSIQTSFVTIRKKKRVLQGEFVNVSYNLRKIGTLLFLYNEGIAIVFYISKINKLVNLTFISAESNPK